MARVISHCKRCDAVAIERSRATIGNVIFITLECGHTYAEDLVASKLSEPASEASGHVIADAKDVPASNDIILEDGRKLYPFQRDGVRFLERCNFRGAILDEMGLGKTIQYVAAIKLYAAELCPVLIICKASLRHQVFRELLLGAGVPAQIVDQGDKPIPGWRAYIISFDLLRNLKWLPELKVRTVIIDECQMIKNNDAKRTQMVRKIVTGTFEVKPRILSDAEKSSRIKRVEMMAINLMTYHGIWGRFDLKFDAARRKELGTTRVYPAGEGIIKGTITLATWHIERDSDDEVIETILHEIAHAITPGAGHRPIWSETAKQIGSNGEEFAWCPGSKAPDNMEVATKYIIAASGTPIKNNAGEFFPILNLLQPERFPKLERYLWQDVTHFWDGYKYRVGALKDPESFAQKTKDFLIRRTRAEVLPDLPKIQRDFQFHQMADDDATAYEKSLNEFGEFYADHGNDEKEMGNILAYLSKMRHICGRAKVPPTAEYVRDFLENHDAGEKLVIFHHHIDVGEMMMEALQEFKPLRITSDLDSAERMAIIDRFREDPACRLLIGPTLAMGEGINLQFCKNTVIMEREWNPANEEQAEGRFSRIGATIDNVMAMYPVAIGTIDEYFAEIVEMKRQIVGETMEMRKFGMDESFGNSKIMKELAEKLFSSGKKSWRKKMMV